MVLGMQPTRFAVHNVYAVNPLSVPCTISSCVLTVITAGWSLVSTQAHCVLVRAVLACLSVCTVLSGSQSEAHQQWWPETHQHCRPEVHQCCHSCSGELSAAASGAAEGTLCSTGGGERQHACTHTHTHTHHTHTATRMHTKSCAHTLMWACSDHPVPAVGGCSTSTGEGRPAQAGSGKC